MAFIGWLLILFTYLSTDLVNKYLKRGRYPFFNFIFSLKGGVPLKKGTLPFFNFIFSLKGGVPLYSKSEFRNIDKSRDGILQYTKK